MGKKKQFKEDGTEDFELEAKEPQEGEDTPGAVSDMLSEDKGEGNVEQDNVPEGHAVVDGSVESIPTAPMSDTGNSGHPSVDYVMQDAKGGVDGQAKADDSTGSKPPLSSEDGTASIETTDEVKQDAPAASATGSDSSGSTDSSDGQPELSEPHPEAAPAVDIAPEAMAELKDAGNKLSPALKKLGEFEHKFAELENEAKARFDHMRRKVTEAVAALEAVFKRG